MDYKTALIIIEATLSTCDEKTRNRIVESLNIGFVPQKKLSNKLTKEYLRNHIKQFM